LFYAASQTLLGEIAHVIEEILLRCPLMPDLDSAFLVDRDLFSTAYSHSVGKLIKSKLLIPSDKKGEMKWR